MADLPGPGGDATTTSIDGTRSIPKPQRRLYVASLIGALIVTVGFSLVAGGVDRVSSRGQVHDLFKGLPIATDLALWLGRILREPLWLALVVFGAVLLALLALKGLLDRILKLLIGLNFLWLVVFLLVSLSSFMAVFRMLMQKKPAGG